MRAGETAELAPLNTVAAKCPCNHNDYTLGSYQSEDNPGFFKENFKLYKVPCVKCGEFCRATRDLPVYYCRGMDQPGVKCNNAFHGLCFGAMQAAASGQESGGIRTSGRRKRF